VISVKELVLIRREILDVGQYRQMVIKSMNNRFQFFREMTYRAQMKLPPMHVASLRQTSECTEGKDLDKEIMANDFLDDMDREKYKYTLIMPCGDRSINGIYCSEQPETIQIHAYARNIVMAIQHMHAKKIINRDLRLQRIVRFQGQLPTIRNTTSEIGILSNYYAEDKLSSEILPFEMIHRSARQENCQNMKEYHKRQVEKIMGPKISVKNGIEMFTIKSFLLGGISICNIAGTPNKSCANLILPPSKDFNIPQASSTFTESQLGRASDRWDGLHQEDHDHYLNFKHEDDSDNHENNLTTSDITSLSTFTDTDILLGRDEKPNNYVDDGQVFVQDGCTAIGGITKTTPVAPSSDARQCIFSLARLTVTAASSEEKCIDAENFTAEVGDSQANQRTSRNVVDSVQITDKDVLFGRGGITNKHPGNQYFRDLIQKVKANYLHCQTNSEKKALSQRIVDDIIQKGGNFLKKLNENAQIISKHDKWMIVTVNEARIKASQALREGKKKTSPILI